MMKQLIMTMLLALGSTFPYTGMAVADTSGSCWSDRACRANLFFGYRDSAYSSQNLPSGNVTVVYGGAKHAESSIFQYRKPGESKQHYGQAELQVNFGDRSAKFEAFDEDSLTDPIVTSEFSDLKFNVASGRITGDVEITSDNSRGRFRGQVRNTSKDSVLGYVYNHNLTGLFVAEETDRIVSSDSEDTVGQYTGINLPSGRHFYSGRVSDSNVNADLPEYYNYLYMAANFDENKVDWLYGEQYNSQVKYHRRGYWYSENSYVGLGLFSGDTRESGGRYLNINTSTGEVTGKILASSSFARVGNVDVNGRFGAGGAGFTATYTGNGYDGSLSANHRFQLGRR